MELLKSGLILLMANGRLRTSWTLTKDMDLASRLYTHNSAFHVFFSDANQDLPGNLYWEALYNACPGSGSIKKSFENSLLASNYNWSIEKMPKSF